MKSTEALFLEYRASGDPAALARVYDRLAPTLLELALREVDIHAAEDALQETFLVLVRHSDRFQAGRPILPWMVGILRHVIRLHLRNHARRIPSERMRLPSSPLPDRQLELNEQRILVTQAIEGLPQAYRVAITMRLLEGLSPRAIAKALGEPDAVIRTRIYRAKAMLRDVLPAGITLAGLFYLAVSRQGRVPLRGWTSKIAATLVVGPLAWWAAAASLEEAPTVRGASLVESVQAVAAIGDETLMSGEAVAVSSTTVPRPVRPRAWLAGHTPTSVLVERSKILSVRCSDSAETSPAVKMAGDVDGDGHGDFLVADWTNQKVSLYSGASGELLRSLSTPTWYNVGWTSGGNIGGIGDLDKDGYGDIVVADPKHSSHGRHAGRVLVLSGRDGAVLHEWHGDRPSRAFGFSVSAVGDINGDGYLDCACGAPADHDGLTGIVRVYSGRDGQLLLTLEPPEARYRSLGGAVAGAGDVDRDGVPDIVAGGAMRGRNGLFSGVVAVLSGRDGHTLHVMHGGACDQMGSAVAGLGDIDGDGHDDIAVGAPFMPVHGVRTGAVLVVSGRTGETLARLVSPDADVCVGHSIAGGVDFDQDGRPDIVIGGSKVDTVSSHVSSNQFLGRSRPAACRLYVFSGRDRTLIREIRYPSAGYNTVDVGDLDGDGSPDIITGCLVRDAKGNLASTAIVLSATSRSLSTDVDEVDASDPSSCQTLRIDAGAKHAGRPYLLLGSASGRRPGVKLPGVTGPVDLDLTPDAYTEFLLARRSVGTLDGSGRATTWVALCTAVKGLASATLHHAAVVLWDNKVAFATNTAVLRVR